MTTRYLVVGTLPVFGHKPGTVFKADLSPDQERRLLARGCISRVRRPRTPKGATLNG